MSSAVARRGRGGLGGQAPGRLKGVRKVDLATMDFIRRMQENPELGAFRVHCALEQKRGAEVSARTVGRGEARGAGPGRADRLVKSVGYACSTDDRKAPLNFVREAGRKPPHVASFQPSKVSSRHSLGRSFAGAGERTASPSSEGGTWRGDAKGPSPPTSGANSNLRQSDYMLLIMAPSSRRLAARRMFALRALSKQPLSGSACVRPLASLPPPPQRWQPGFRA